MTQTQHILVPANGDEPHMTDDPAPVHIHRTWAHPKFGRKLGIELPPPWEDDREPKTKDVFKSALEWDRTHRSWNEAGGEWEADFDELNHVVDTMVDEGLDVTVALPVAKQFDTRYVFLPQFRAEQSRLGDAAATA